MLLQDLCYLQPNLVLSDTQRRLGGDHQSTEKGAAEKMSRKHKQSLLEWPRLSLPALAVRNLGSLGCPLSLLSSPHSVTSSFFRLSVQEPEFIFLNSAFAQPYFTPETSFLPAGYPLTSHRESCMGKSWVDKQWLKQ